MSPFCDLARLFSAVFEERFQEVGGFPFEEPGPDRKGMVEAAVGGGVVKGTRVASLRVGGSVDEAVQAGGVGAAGVRAVVMAEERE